MEKFSLWAQGIIVAVIIGTILEMLLPKSSTSKYVKVVIGLFILFTIVTPVINIFSKDEIDINSMTDIEKYGLETTMADVSLENIETQQNNQIKNMYKENLALDIQTKVQIKGYKTDFVIVEIANDDSYALTKIEFKVSEKNEEKKKEKEVTSIVDNIENIKISLSNNQNSEQTENSCILNRSEQKSLKQYLSETYEISEDNIYIL